MSYRLLQAASSDNEESSKAESELTRCLSELYQRKSHEESTVVNQDHSRKKRMLIDSLFLEAVIFPFETIFKTVILSKKETKG